MNQPSRFGPPRRSSSDAGLIVGRLEGHGPANYQFRADQKPSYFVKVATNRGVRVLWGKDLARALTESRTQPKIGSVIGVRRTGSETFSIPERRRNAAGEVIETQRTVKRHQWMIETAQFFAERIQLARRVRDAHAEVRAAAKSRPELASTFLSLRGAQVIAERRIADPKDREIFMSLVREAMTKSIRNGNPLPDIRLRHRPKQPEKPTPAPTKKREDPTR